MDDAGVHECHGGAILAGIGGSAMVVRIEEAKRLEEERSRDGCG